MSPIDWITRKDGDSKPAKERAPPQGGTKKPPLG